MKSRKASFKYFYRTFLSRGFIAYASAVVIALFIIMAVFAPILTPYEPNVVDLSSSLLRPSAAHIFGCDLHGRDVLTRILYGTRVSLVISLLSCAVGAIIGMMLGLIAGYLEGPVSTTIMRFVDVQLAIPPMLFMIIMGLFLGRGIFGMVLALSFSMQPGFIRMMYGIVLSLKDSDYITALKFANVKTLKIIIKHLLPNTFPTMMVMFALRLGGAIMAETTLSFLGIGIQQPTPSWGSMVSEGYQYIFTHPMLAFIPGFCIMMLVLAFNIFGDSLRDAIDPRLKGKL
jgi:peptide/nickel transport system permease protein